MTKYKIIFKRNLCIGAASCETEFKEKFKVNNDNKADLLGGKETSPETFEIEIDKSLIEKAKRAVEGCPVAAIALEEK